MTPATEAEPGIRKDALELERQRTKVELEGRRSLTEPEGRGAAGGVEPEAADGTQRLEVETRDAPAMTPLNTGRPVAIPPYRWWAEDEQKGCQEKAVAMVRTDTEVVGEEGWVGNPDS